MKLLGDRNWYLPAWLEWLPHFDHELDVESDEPESRSRVTERPPARKREAGDRLRPDHRPLILIAILAIGLAYLKVASGGDSVSVPAGAKAGQLTLHPCHYGTEQGGYAADCGTLVVPENRARPGSRLIALPVTRIKALSTHPGAPVFRLEGGPGITNMKFSKASRIAGRHDVVLVGYRGVDGSVRLDCPEVASALKRSTDLLGEKSFRAYSDGFRSCAARLKADGVDLAGYSIPAQVDDLEAARKALGYWPDRPDQRERGHPHRDDLRLAVPEEHPPLGDDRRQPARQLPLGPEDDRRADPASTPACARRTSFCSKRTDDLAASMRKAATQHARPLLGPPVRPERRADRLFYGLMESTSVAEPLSAPMTLNTLALGLEGRRQRRLVHVAGRPHGVPRSPSPGASSPRWAGPTPSPPSITSRKARTGPTRSSAIPGRSSSTPAGD